LILPNPSVDANARHQLYIERLAATNANTLDPELKALAAYVRARLAAEGSTIPSKRVMREIIRDVKAKFSRTYDKWQNQTGKFLDELNRYETQFQTTLLDKETTDNFTPVKPKNSTAKAAAENTPLMIGSNGGAVALAALVGNFSKAETKKATALIEAGFYNGSSTSDISASIAGTRKNSFKDGVMLGTKRNAKSISKTSAVHVSNTAKGIVYDENERAVKGWIVTSVLDNRTSKTCFTGATKVTPCFDIEKLYRAKYTGEIITIALSTGEKIEGTPCHPVLTQEGWTALGEIDPSNHIVYAAGGDVARIRGNQNISVETTFAELFDSLSKSAGLDIVRSESASTTDFYGDAVGFDGKVDIVDAERHLRGDVKPSFFKRVKNYCFGSVELTSRFNAFRSALSKTGRLFPVVETSKLTTCFLKRFENAGLRDRQTPFYFARSNTLIEKLNGLNFFPFNFVRNVPSSGWLPETEVVQKASNGGGGGFVAFSDTSSGFAAEVTAANVIGKSSEFKSCHVYTLQTGQGYYISGGIIVKNCRGLDGKQVARGENFSKPPYHLNCRTVARPWLREDLEAIKGAERETKGATGEEFEPTKKDYYAWLKQQPAFFQDDVLGATEGKIFRNAGLTPQQFKTATIKRDGTPLTIDEMAAKDARIAEYLAEGK